MIEAKYKPGERIRCVASNANGYPCRKTIGVAPYCTVIVREEAKAVGNTIQHRCRACGAMMEIELVLDDRG